MEKRSWEGSGIDLQALNESSGEIVVQIDRALIRPVEVNHQFGDSSTAQERLGWTCGIEFKVGSSFHPFYDEAFPLRS